MVLIISYKNKEARSLSEIFYFMGILSYGTTLYEGLSEISPLYRAIILVHPEKFPDPRDYVERIRSYSSSIPVFGISDDLKSMKQCEEYLSMTFKYATYSSILASKMAKYAHEHKLPVLGDYRVAGINAAADQTNVTCFERPIVLTKTQKMILRFLIRSYPNPMMTRKILKYAFRQSRVPENSTVRTHISIINKKYREMFGRNIITMLPFEGYVIITPKLVKDRNLEYLMKQDES